MAHAGTILRKNFIEYASYVVKDRAIPDVADGFKPVQRRILHTLFQEDDGKFHKSANIVGACMKYHPHGDASIYEALVNLANCDLLIEKQGNFGNLLTGDRAAASRYTECRLLPIAKKILYNPELTEYVESYDGRNQEPVVFPAKIPVVLIQGCEGIAVGMSTRILPHNAAEVVGAMEAAIRGEEFALYPDFPGGGIIDVSKYDDGRGSVSVRAKFDTSDPKKIVVKELPFTVTSEDLIADIDRVAKLGKLKVAQISDYTSAEVNIEINLARGTYAKDTIDALYAYTKAEQKISVNSLVIKDRYPVVMGVSEIVRWHADHLIEVLRGELQIEKGHLLDRLQARTLERIFVEERIYKAIEEQKTEEGVRTAITDGFVPFADELVREISDEDIDRLLKLPIRRISAFDIEKNKSEIEEINKAIRLCEKRLKNLKGYALEYLEGLKKDLKDCRRRTEIASFETVNVKAVAKRDQSLRYDSSTGYLGYGVRTGDELLKVSVFDRILIIQKDGTYRVTDAPEKLYVGKGLLYAGFADREELQKIVFTILFQERDLKFTLIKRCRITSFTLNKIYKLLPEGNFRLIKLSTYDNAEVTLVYNREGGRGAKEKSFFFSDYKIKGPSTAGVTVSRKEVSSIKLRKVRLEEITPAEDDNTPTLFDGGAADAQPGTPAEAKSSPVIKSAPALPQDASDDAAPGLDFGDSSDGE